MDAMMMNRVGSTTPSANNNTSTSSNNIDNRSTRIRTGNDNVKQNQNQNQSVDSRKEDEKKRLENQRQRDNVVSISRDGDTVQINSQDDNRTRQSQDGQVTMKKSEQETSRKKEEEKSYLQQQLDDKKAAQEADSKKQITSFAGYTVSDIERLYQQGRISRYDYEKQLSIREERLNSSNSSNSENSKKMSSLEGTLTKANMDKNAIDKAFSDNANNNANVSATDRLKAMQRIQESNNTQETMKINEGRTQWRYQLQA